MLPRGPQQRTRRPAFPRPSTTAKGARPKPIRGGGNTKEANLAQQHATLDGPDLGDLVLVLLAGTLAGLRDRLERDGFSEASAFVADLTTRCDTYLEGLGA